MSRHDCLFLNIQIVFQLHERARTTSLRRLLEWPFTMRNQSCRNFAVLLQLPTWKWIILCDENQIWHLKNFWFCDDFLCKTLIFLSLQWLESVYFVSRYCCKVSVCQILPRLICKWNYETQLSKAKHKTKILSDITGLLWSTK